MRIRIGGRLAFGYRLRASLYAIGRRLFNGEMNDRTKRDILSDVEAALEIVRGPLSKHEGGVEAVDFNMETGTLTVRLLGMCVGCPMADQTLHAIVGDTVESMVPEVREIVNV